MLRTSVEPEGHVTAPAQLPHGLSIVIPVYNSATILPGLIARLSPVLAGTGLAYEVILVNDGSRDTSWDTITRLARTYPWVRGLCLMRNYGQHNALLAGMRDARFDVTMTMDDDLQHPPEELPTLLAALTGEVDVVYAPPAQEQHGVLRNVASVITKMALQSSMGASTARMASAWRVFRTHLREASSGFNGPFVSVDVLLTWGTTRFAAVPLRHDPRAGGTSNYTLMALVRHALNMMTGFSVLPLQLASLMGFAFTIFGGLVLVFVVGRYMWQGTTVAGFPFLASIVAIFSGAQLFALGIMGEYLARMHFRSMDKPSYTVKSRIGEDRVYP